MPPAAVGSPSRAQRLDQGDDRNEALGLQLQDRLFVRQFRALGDSHFEISNHTAFVPGEGDFQRAAGGLERGVFLLKLLGEQAHGRELVFHILERAEDRLAVVGDGGVIAGADGG